MSYTNPELDFSIVSNSNTAPSQHKNFSEHHSPCKSHTKSMSRSRRSDRRPVKEISGVGMLSGFTKFGKGAKRPRKEYLRMTTFRK